MVGVQHSVIGWLDFLACWVGGVFGEKAALGLICLRWLELFKLIGLALKQINFACNHTRAALCSINPLNLISLSPTLR